jgi:hypothetical protein
MDPSICTEQIIVLFDGRDAHNRKANILRQAAWMWSLATLSIKYQ